MTKIITTWAKKNEWLLIILAITVLLRIPSWFEPYWYGDEGIYLTIGQALRKGVSLYNQIHDNKPPMLYLMAAIADGNLFWFKFIATIWNIVTIGVFYKLAGKICGSKRMAILTALVFALLTAWPKLEGNIANAELFFLLPTILAIYLLWGKKVSYKKALVAGLVLGFGALFKMPAILEAGIWPIIWLIYGDKEWWKKSLLLCVGIAIPIAISVIYYWLAGAGQEYLVAAWAQNLPYLSSWKAASDGSGIFSLKGRIALSCIALAPVAGLARRIGAKGTIVGLWGIITLFTSLLSGRPYPHYMLQGAGVMAASLMLLGQGKRIERIIGAGVVAGFIGAAVVFKFYGYPVFDYYKNFVKWAGKQQTTEQYFSWFNNQVNNNYEIAATIAAGSRASDKLFVWGDEPMIYALAKRAPTGKYIVKYHIKDYRGEQETMERLTLEPPKYVVSFGQEEELPGFTSWLLNSYQLQKTVGQARIYRMSILGGQYN